MCHYYSHNSQAVHTWDHKLVSQAIHAQWKGGRQVYNCLDLTKTQIWRSDTGIIKQSMIIAIIQAPPISGPSILQDLRLLRHAYIEHHLGLWPDWAHRHLYSFSYPCKPYAPPIGLHTIDWELTFSLIHYIQSTENTFYFSMWTHTVLSDGKPSNTIKGTINHMFFMVSPGC